MRHCISIWLTKVQLQHNVAVGQIHGPLRSSLASRIVSVLCQTRPYISSFLKCEVPEQYTVSAVHILIGTDRAALCSTDTRIDFQPRTISTVDKYVNYKQKMTQMEI